MNSGQTCSHFKVSKEEIFQVLNILEFLIPSLFLKHKQRAPMRLLKTNSHRNFLSYNKYCIPKKSRKTIQWERLNITAQRITHKIEMLLRVLVSSECNRRTLLFQSKKSHQLDEG